MCLYMADVGSCINIRVDRYIGQNKKMMFARGQLVLPAYKEFEASLTADKIASHTNPGGYIDSCETNQSQKRLSHIHYIRRRI